jgi:hypothetical protein
MILDSDIDNECIFCLGLLNNCKNSDIANIINTNIKLKCNHIFHLDCFFLYVKYNSKKLDALKCPLCRNEILKNDIRKILISYYFLLKKLDLKISICNLFNFLKICFAFNIRRQDIISDDDDDDTQEFLKKKICFRLTQIIKIILII